MYHKMHVAEMQPKSTNMDGGSLWIKLRICCPWDVPFGKMPDRRKTAAHRSAIRIISLLVNLAADINAAGAIKPVTTDELQHQLSFSSPSFPCVCGLVIPLPYDSSLCE
jgi:hypothetical protein